MNGSIAAHVARLEADLAGFWSTPDLTPEGLPVAKARASTMTYVAAGNHEEVERLEEQAEALAETHAGRSFLITADGRLPAWEMKTGWSATCRRDGEVPICRDRVELTFGVAAADRVASVVLALALSDVPLIVEAAPGAAHEVTAPLITIADRLIIDSAGISPARAADLARRAKGTVADRAFIRTQSLRELVARFFDEAPSALRAIRRVGITRDPGPAPDPAALFIGWLASRLGWTFQTRHAARAADGAPVEIVLGDAPEGAVADPEGFRRLWSIHIEAELGGAPLTLGCARMPEAPGTVRWTMAGARSAEHVHPLGRRDETWVLTKAIDAAPGDRVLREAILAAADWSSR